jgi:protein-tyrosine-phosphatase
MGLPETVLFLCHHNAAKSILAGAYFDQQAFARGLPFRANSADTSLPQDKTPPLVSGSPFTKAGVPPPPRALPPGGMRRVAPA